MVPEGNGLHAVRAILASIWASTKQLMAAAAMATRVIPKVASKSNPKGGTSGKASSMPITAQKEISMLTLGLVSARYCLARFWAMGGARVDDMVLVLTDARGLE